MEKQSRILAVDDNPTNLAVMEEMLRGDYVLRTADSGEEALEMAPAFQPDILLLDITMPGIDGYETCRSMRMTPELNGTKIIMVSAKAMVSERIEGYGAGADDYLTKPFAEDELLAKVNVFLRLKSVDEVEKVKSDATRQTLARWISERDKT